MFSYTPSNQLELFDFKMEFEGKLNPNNRWVKLSKIIDWDLLAHIYSKYFSATMGAKSVDARIVIGALIIKHIEGKDDRGTLELIQENPYMQYFLGLDHFTYKRLFDPSLFVHIRKRLGNADFDQMNQRIISKALGLDIEANANESSEQATNDEDQPNDDNVKEALEDSTPTPPPPHNPEEQKASPNKGKLQMDATVADVNIKYPTDLNLLNEAREKLEAIVDKLCTTLPIKKPRTYRVIARKKYLNIAKKKKKSKNEIRRGIGEQLRFVKRDLGHIDTIFEQHPLSIGQLNHEEYKNLLVIKTLYQQQLEMYNTKTNSIEDRIVSIQQPHIRPIVRGKIGRTVEFGAKINVSLQKGYARINQIGFDPFNEGKYLIDQVEAYKKLNGCYPELVQTDDIYMTRENRKYLKERNIRHTGRPLGRKPKVELSQEEKEKQRKEKNERNHIEGTFGTGKSKYKLNQILAKLPQTQESWIGAIILVMNILKLSREYFWLFFNWIILTQKKCNKLENIPFFPKYYRIIA